MKLIDLQHNKNVGVNRIYYKLMKLRKMETGGSSQCDFTVIESHKDKVYKK